jgi:hypothetical protein
VALGAFSELGTRVQGFALKASIGMSLRSDEVPSLEFFEEKFRDPWLGPTGNLAHNVCMSASAR